MAHEEEEEPKKVRYPLDSNSYNILHEVGFSDGAVVYKAVCVPLDSMVVAIKAIDLDQSLADLETVRRQAESMSLLSHPNILDVHCSFTVDHRLWVVMPFMSAGSLQSIISSSFPDGIRAMHCHNSQRNSKRLVLSSQRRIPSQRHQGR